jgi:protein SCO1/2
VERLPKGLKGVTVKDKLGDIASLDTKLVDHRGTKVRFGDYFADGKPVVLTLNYYRCPTLCNIQLNELTRALRGLKWAPGETFRLVTVSIDHREKHTLGRKKRASHIKSLGRGEVDWSFLVGSKEQVKKLADSVGFGYRYDPEQDQWAHPAVVTFISPEGKISRYLYGLEYTSRDLQFAIMEAAEGRVGSTVDKLILSCFHYDATLGRYGPFAFGIMRLGGAVTLVLLGLFLARLWRRERRQRRRDEAAPTVHGDIVGEESP